MVEFAKNGFASGPKASVGPESLERRSLAGLDREGAYVRAPQNAVTEPSVAESFNIALNMRGSRYGEPKPNTLEESALADALKRIRPTIELRAEISRRISDLPVGAVLNS